MPEPSVADRPGGPPAVPLGLTTTEVERRRRAGLGNDVEVRTTRSVLDIVRANTLTRFNAIIGSLVVVIFAFGDPIDAAFGAVSLLNSGIGIVQELRAKRLLDTVQVLLVPAIDVHRDGTLARLPPDELVQGDVIELRSGDQVPVDGLIVATDGLEVDESSLTGESEPVAKATTEEVRSGSAVVTGTATIEAVHVGADSWAHKLTAEAKDFSLTRSELRVGVDRLLQVVSWSLPPLTALLVWSQLLAAEVVADALVAAVAGVVSLVPQGLVLLVSMTMAIAVIRLAKNRVVVQELQAVEGLARVDVLCVDKTGTLTTGRLTVDAIEPVGITDCEVRSGIAALGRLDTGRNPTIDALLSAVAGDDTTTNEAWNVSETVPFSSRWKWSGAHFEQHGTWILGAPEVILDHIRSEPGSVAATGRAAIDDLVDRVADLAAKARRVLLVAQSDDPFGLDGSLPTSLHPVGLISLMEEIRPDATATMEFFRRQNVQLKILSGDNPATVAAVAAEIGIEGAHDYLDLREHESMTEIPAETTVFGRVLPEQKRDIVELLQSRGHTVAMTGDGVNDIPSLKAADIGIAVDTATPATKAISQLVLLDGRFDRLPNVVGEGRRVIANMERVSSLFVTKTVYAATLVIVVGILNAPFPFLPRHMSLVGALTIGIPAFALSFRPSDEPCRPGYLRRVLEFSLPAGLVAATATFTAFWAARSPVGGADLLQARTAATLTLILVGLWLLYRLVRPADRFEAYLILGLLGVSALALVPSPWSESYGLDLPAWRVTLTLVVVLTATIVALNALLDLTPRARRPRGRSD